MISIQNPTVRSLRSVISSLPASRSPLPAAVSPHVNRQELQSITHQMTVLYVCIDDFLKKHPQWQKWRRSPNSTPTFTDAEVLTIALLQGCLKVATLKHAYQIIATDFADAFPKIPSYCQFVARLHALQSLVGRLIQEVLPALDGDVFLMDSKPIPVCKPIRHGRVRLLREEGAYFGKNSCGWYFGFKLHTIAHRTGTILCAFLTPANVPDRDLALALADAVDGGLLLADRAYLTKEMQKQFKEQADLLLITPQNVNAKKKALISSLRERIETTFSQLHDRFVDRVRSRSFHGLCNTISSRFSISTFATRDC